MPAAWDISDDRLVVDLTQIWSNMNGQAFHCALFKNNYTPVPGTDLADFDFADFPGYVAQMVPDGDWGSPSITDHVASILNGAPVTFTASSGSWSPQTIYGYVILTEDDEYAWCERFGSPRDIGPGESLVINLEYRLATYPAS